MSRIYSGDREVTDLEVYARLKTILDQWHAAHKGDWLGTFGTDITRESNFDQSQEKHAHIANKYIRLDVGSSGAFMIDQNDGRIYAIKGYGKVNKKKCAGSLNDLSFDGKTLFETRFKYGNFDLTEGK